MRQLLMQTVGQSGRRRDQSFGVIQPRHETRAAIRIGAVAIYFFDAAVRMRMMRDDAFRFTVRAAYSHVFLLSPFQ